jgi:hypothetical protein
MPVVPDERCPATGRASGWRWLGLAVAVLTLLCVVGYGNARRTHLLVRYESGCITRGNLEGGGRDLWNWEYRCSELRRYFAQPDDLEIEYAPLIAVEEAVREPLRRRPSVCSLPGDPPGFPSQGLARPTWCGPPPKGR